MRMKLFGFILAIVVVVSLGWCLDGLSSEQKEDKEAYKAEMEERLRGLEAKLDELKAKTGEVKEDANGLWRELNKKKAFLLMNSQLLMLSG